MWYLVIDCRNRVVHSFTAENRAEAMAYLKHCYPSNWRHLKLVFNLDELPENTSLLQSL